MNHPLLGTPILGNLQINPANLKTHWGASSTTEARTTKLGSNTFSRMDMRPTNLPETHWYQYCKITITVPTCRLFQL